MDTPPRDSSQANRQPKLLAQVRELMRRKYYSLVTERTYIYWIRQFIFFHNKVHPRTLPPQAIATFLTQLATVRNVSPSTQNQALNAIVFLYREVLGLDTEGLAGIEWAKPRLRIPVVFTREEVAAILGLLRDQQQLIAALLYGSGLRLAECLRLRRKDIDFERNQIAIWDSKSMQDRVVMLPKPLKDPLFEHLKAIRPLWMEDRRKGTPGVELPHAIEGKYPNAGAMWKWFWVFWDIKTCELQ